MKQHFVPEVYLRQWCDEEGYLIRYRRVGPPDAPQLRPDRKVPKGICWERDLYSLPEGGIANGMTGDEIEHLLSKKVEQTIESIVTVVGDRSGPLEPAVGDQVTWLMQTFVARAPSSLAASESGVAAFVVENEARIRQTLARAVTPTIKAELSQYFDPRFPAVAARAALAGIVGAQPEPMRGWFGGIVHVLHAAAVRRMLNVVGLSAFPTFENPVVQWEDNPAGLVASFSLSPNVLAFVIQNGGECGWEQALRHIMMPLSYRQSAICRQRATDGHWLVRAQNLMPWKQGE
jgi:uncharacterized protein DUF4238